MNTNVKLIILFMFILIVPVRGAEKSGMITSDLRKTYLELAQVWSPTQISNMDVLAGAQNNISVPPEAEITCRYIEWKKKPSGAAPKFNCKIVGSGEVVRIKYGHDSREIFSEVAGTRLFWLLGFYSDDVYPVRVRCLGCPENDPFHPEKKERRIERQFRYAIMEKNYDGVILEEKEDQGWSWAELDEVLAQKDSASRERIDALKLLAVFVQHGDNRASQQRMGCARQDMQNGRCLRPILMVQDLGSTFGRAGWTTGQKGKMNFEAWEDKPIWDHFAEKEHLDRTGLRVCIGNITSSILSGDSGLDKPLISEEGRKFLAGLLNQLSDQQIKDLFQVARADQMNDTIEVDGVQRPVTLDDWVSAFREKRDQIDERECPEPQ